MKDSTRMIMEPTHFQRILKTDSHLSTFNFYFIPFKWPTVKSCPNHTHKSS